MEKSFIVLNILRSVRVNNLSTTLFVTTLAEYKYPQRRTRLLGTSFLRRWINVRADGERAGRRANWRADWTTGARVVQTGVGAVRSNGLTFVGVLSSAMPMRSLRQCRNAVS